MQSLYDIEKIKSHFEKGGNIISFMKENSDSNQTTIEQILMSYDFQAGSYIDFVKKNPDYINQHSDNISKIINDLGVFNSVLEVGVGEATTFVPVLKKLANIPQFQLGFDLSWSRLRHAMTYAEEYTLRDINFFCANLFNIPLENNSIELVYTSHSVEPNGGKEKDALTELLRITSKYLVLLEPSYHFGSEAAKERMRRHGYVTNLHQTAKDMGCQIIHYGLFESQYSNPLNPTELLIIKKNENSIHPSFICPISRKELIRHNGEFYSKDGLFVYPEISGIPCFLAQNAVIATKYTTFI